MTPTTHMSPVRCQYVGRSARRALIISTAGRLTDQMKRPPAAKSRTRPRSPAVAVWSQLNSVRGDLVGDGAGVAGHGGRVGVDLVEEQFQGAGDAGRGGLLEGDGDRGGGEGDGSGQAADDGLAGDGAVFVVVTQVVVELA